MEIELPGERIKKVKDEYNAQLLKIPGVVGGGDQ